MTCGGGTEVLLQQQQQQQQRTVAATAKDTASAQKAIAKEEVVAASLLAQHPEVGSPTGSTAAPESGRQQAPRALLSAVVALLAAHGGGLGVDALLSLRIEDVQLQHDKNDSGGGVTFVVNLSAGKDASNHSSSCSTTTAVHGPAHNGSIQLQGASTSFVVNGAAARTLGEYISHLPRGVQHLLLQPRGDEPSAAATAAGGGGAVPGSAPAWYRNRVLSSEQLMTLLPPPPPAPLEAEALHHTLLQGIPRRRRTTKARPAGSIVSVITPSGTQQPGQLPGPSGLQEQAASGDDTVAVLDEVASALLELGDFSRTNSATGTAEMAAAKDAAAVEQGVQPGGQQPQQQQQQQKGGQQPQHGDHGASGAPPAVEQERSTMNLCAPGLGKRPLIELERPRVGGGAEVEPASRVASCQAPRDTLLGSADVPHTAAAVASKRARHVQHSHDFALATNNAPSSPNSIEACTSYESLYDGASPFKAAQQLLAAYGPGGREPYMPPAAAQMPLNVLPSCFVSSNPSFSELITVMNYGPSALGDPECAAAVMKGNAPSVAAAAAPAGGITPHMGDDREAAAVRAQQQRALDNMLVAQALSQLPQVASMHSLQSPRSSEAMHSPTSGGGGGRVGASHTSAAPWCADDRGSSAQLSALQGGSASLSGSLSQATLGSAVTPPPLPPCSSSGGSSSACGPASPATASAKCDQHRQLAELVCCVVEKTLEPLQRASAEHGRQQPLVPLRHLLNVIEDAVALVRSQVKAPAPAAAGDPAGQQQQQPYFGELRLLDSIVKSLNHTAVDAQPHELTQQEPGATLPTIGACNCAA